MRVLPHQRHSAYPTVQNFADTIGKPTLRTFTFLVPLLREPVTVRQLARVLLYIGRGMGMARVPPV